LILSTGQRSFLIINTKRRMKNSPSFEGLC
jgi:hypothetical protein